MEFLFLGNQGNIAEDAITSLLIQRSQDSVIVRFRVAEPLACQHFLNTMNESNQISTRPLISAGCPRAPSLLWHPLKECTRALLQGEFRTPHFLSLHPALALHFSNSLFSSSPLSY